MLFLLVVTAALAARSLPLTVPSTIMALVTASGAILSPVTAPLASCPVPMPASATPRVTSPALPPPLRPVPAATPVMVPPVPSALMVMVSPTSRSCSLACKWSYISPSGTITTKEPFGLECGKANSHGVVTLLAVSPDVSAKLAPS